jgi:hypothetical protein
VDFWTWKESLGFCRFVRVFTLLRAHSLFSTALCLAHHSAFKQNLSRFEAPRIHHSARRVARVQHASVFECRHARPPGPIASQAPALAARTRFDRDGRQSDINVTHSAGNARAEPGSGECFDTREISGLMIITLKNAMIPAKIYAVQSSVVKLALLLACCLCAINIFCEISSGVLLPVVACVRLFVCCLVHIASRLARYILGHNRLQPP